MTVMDLNTFYSTSSCEKRLTNEQIERLKTKDFDSIEKV